MSRGRKIAVVLLLTVVGWLLLDDGRSTPAGSSVASNRGPAVINAADSDAPTFDSADNADPASLSRAGGSRSVTDRSVPLPRERSSMTNQSAGRAVAASPASPSWPDADPVVSHTDATTDQTNEFSRNDATRRMSSGRRGIRFTGTIEALH